MKMALILCDTHATLCQQGCQATVFHSHKSFPWAKFKSLHLVLNSAEFDITQTTIPPMTWLDRFLFTRQRLRHAQKDNLHGATLIDDHLIEFSCPPSPYIEEWLKAIRSHHRRILSLKPYLILPNPMKDQDTYLVLTDHKNLGLRQTAYKGNQLLLSRLTNSPEQFGHEVQTTLTYLKDRYQCQSVNIQAYVDQGLAKQLSNFHTLSLHALTDNMCAESLALTHLQRLYAFKPPKAPQKQRATKILYRGLIAACIAVLPLTIWQALSLYSATTELQHLKDQRETLAHAKRPKTTQKEKKIPVSIRLNAILFFDETNWCIWLNNKKITPSNCPDYVEIKTVSSESVELIWHHDLVTREVSLKVNDTFELAQ